MTGGAFPWRFRGVVACGGSSLRGSLPPEEGRENSECSDKSEGLLFSYPWLRPEHRTRQDIGSLSAIALGIVSFLLRPRLALVELDFLS